MSGLSRPTSDFRAARDGRMSLPLYIDIDLSTARSIVDLSAKVVPIAGNSFYIDLDKTNGGEAVVHFQDTTLSPTSAPFYVTPGFIANVTFTQILIENTAQPNKRLRIFYGVDVNFQAGVSANINTTSVVIPLEYQFAFADYTSMAFNTQIDVFSAAQNPNGAYVWYANFMAQSADPLVMFSSYGINSDRIVMANSVSTNGGYTVTGGLPNPIRVPAGKPFRYYARANEVYGFRSALYTLL